MATKYVSPVTYLNIARLRQIARDLNIANDLSTPSSTLITAINNA